MIEGQMNGGSNDRGSNEWRVKRMEGHMNGWSSDKGSNGGRSSDRR